MVFFFSSKQFFSLLLLLLLRLLFECIDFFWKSIKSYVANEQSKRFEKLVRINIDFLINLVRKTFFPSLSVKIEKEIE